MGRTVLRGTAVAALVAALISVAAAGASSASSRRSGPPPIAAMRSSAGEIHKIRHVVIIMQENRSFDNYFGTFPGADGIPGLAGNHGKVPCVPDPHKKCVKPFHDRYAVNSGGPYFSSYAEKDIDGGKMDGFVRSLGATTRNCHHCHSVPPDDVMGYHTGADIPNYWEYARHFVLQDHMFEAVRSWSLPSHLYLVSLWSAICKSAGDPSSCSSAVDGPPPGGSSPHPRPVYAWTDLTYLLHKAHVSWRYYIFKGIEPDCESNATLTCKPVTQGPTTPSFWNPLPYFTDVHQDHQLRNIQSLNGFFAAVNANKLPAVSWIVPNFRVGEHPQAPISAGQTYVTGLINAIMQSPAWKSTAIFLAWDDWSGFYDNMDPPSVDALGYGLRVPALVISPYARQGFIDHQVLSFDAYAKFIEDDFLSGQRLDPNTDGRPDPRPDVREDASVLGNLIKDFNFNQPARKPYILPVQPKTDLIEPH